MGAIMRAHDWASTPLGPIRRWPQSLRSTLSVVLNSPVMGTILWGPDLLMLYNDAYLPSMADRHPHALGRPVLEVWGAAWEQVAPPFHRAMATGQGFLNRDVELRILRHGQPVTTYWDFSAAAIRGEDGSIVGLLNQGFETTDQVLTLRALRHSDERLSLALSAGNIIGTWDWDIVADRVVADTRFCRLYSVDPALGSAGAPIDAFFASVLPDDLLMLRSAIATAMRTGDHFTAEYRLRLADGTVRWVAVQGRCLLDPDGKPLHFPGVSFDISERKDAELRLRELNADLERKVAERARERGKTWDLSPDLLGVLNHRGYFESVNPAWLATLGWTPEEIARTVFLELLHPEDLSRTRAAFEATLAGQPAIRFENRYRHKDGGYRWLSWVAIPEGDKVYCSARDITAAKAAEAQLVQAEDTLRQSQKMDAVGQLTGGLAHDFNNLLSGISGSLELTQARIAQGRVAEADRYINAAQGAARRAAALTHRLLAFSRRQTLDPKPTDVNRLVTGMEELIRRTLGPEICLKSRTNEDLWTTLVDPGLLENGLLNLCINARDAMADGGMLTIETDNVVLDAAAGRDDNLPPGRYVTLCVGDTGTGMSPDIIAHAFDPFFTTKPTGQGTGLGLSMIYGFARQSGGDVRIDSTIGQGTKVCVYLPRHIGEAEAAAAPVKLPDLSRAEQGETVLVVDDEPTVRMLVTEVLEEHGYVAIEAADGAAGLQVLQSDARVDLLVTDVGLPGGLNGRQMADAARSVRPDLKVLFITGYAENAVLNQADMATGMQVLTKPFALELLADRIKGLIAGR